VADAIARTFRRLLMIVNRIRPDPAQAPGTQAPSRLTQQAAQDLCKVPLSADAARP